jgi:hypothetical protein
VEVGRPGVSAFILPAAQPAQGEADPIAAAAKGGASIVVFGGYQVLDGNIRLTGQVVDTATGQTIATLSATGPIKDLFKLEDSLGEQLRKAMPQHAPPAPPVASAPPLDNYPPVTSSSGYYYSSPNDSYTPVTYAAPDYTSYPTYYPTYYPSYYPYYYPFSSSFIIFNSGFHSHCFNNRFTPICNRPVNCNNFVNCGSFSRGGFVARGSFGNTIRPVPMPVSGPHAFGMPMSSFRGGFGNAGGAAFAGRAPAFGGGFGGGGLHFGGGGMAGGRGAMGGMGGRR